MGNGTTEKHALQARAQRTRETVLRAAADVFDQLGYEATTFEAVAEHAGVAKGGVAYHFKSKAIMARAVIEAQNAASQQLMTESDTWDVDGLETIRRLLDSFAHAFQDSAIARGGLRLAIEHEQFDERLPTPFVGWIDRVAALLKRGQADGSVAANINCQETAHIIISSFVGIEEISARLSHRADLVEQVDRWWSWIKPLLAS